MDGESSRKILDRQYHARVASEYDRTLTRTHGIYGRYSPLRWIRRFKELGVNGTVLDLGTGTGALAIPIACEGYFVIALDHSLDMLSIAREKAARERVTSNICFIVGDVESLPFSSGSVDAVVCSGLLHHLETLEPTIAEASRVLGSRGSIFITEPCRETTFLSRWINVLLRCLAGIVRRLFAGREYGKGSSAGGIHLLKADPHQEGPVSSTELVSLCRKYDIHLVDLHFLIHLQYISFLPDRLRLVLTLILSAPFRKNRGDILFLEGTKAGQASRT